MPIIGLTESGKHIDWVKRSVMSEGYRQGEIDYIFCNDDYLLALNEKFLGHTTLTDVITFDYGSEEELCGEVYISEERVIDNAAKYDVRIIEEMRRVMIHGVLHLLGYDDKNEGDRRVMRAKEDEKLNMFHVEQ